MKRIGRESIKRKEINKWYSKKQKERRLTKKRIRDNFRNAKIGSWVGGGEREEESANQRERERDEEWSHGV